MPKLNRNHLQLLPRALERGNELKISKKQIHSETSFCEMFLIKSLFQLNLVSANLSPCCRQVQINPFNANNQREKMIQD